MDYSNQVRDSTEETFVIFTFLFCLSFRSHFARAHLAWGATGPVGQTARNRLKIGVRREGTLSNQLLES